MCQDCGKQHDWTDTCRVSDLPRAIVAEGDYSIRETAGQGRGLWKSYQESGARVAYFVGATAGKDRDSLLVAIDAAEEEMRCMLADLVHEVFDA